MTEAKRKEEILRRCLRESGSMAIAFSGGVDSTYLLHVAHEALRERAIAITMRLASVPEREIAEAKDFCKAKGIRHLIVDIDQFQIEEFRENSVNRCYMCKRRLFEVVLDKARKEGISCVADGTNCNDMGQYRPGLKALEELGIESPLCRAGLYKEEIRILSKAAGLPTWEKPSFACLATRFPYGETITDNKLRMVEDGEQWLFEMGFRQFRVRINGVTARIEVLPEEMGKLFSLREEADRVFRGLGFIYVTADLRGFRSGSMDEVREKEISGY